MSKALTQTGSVGLAQAAERVAKLNLLNGSEVIILAIKPSLWYVLGVSGRWLAVLLPVSIACWWAWQISWFTGQAQVLLGIALAGVSIRLAFGLLQWQSQVYVLTNLRILRIQGVLRVEMFQCHLLRLKDVTLSSGFAEKLLGLGTIGLVADSSAQPGAHWVNVRHPVEVSQQILEAINTLKGRSNNQSSAELPPGILPAEESPNIRR